MPRLKATPQEKAAHQVVSNIKYYCCLYNISTIKRCNIMKYSEKTDRRRMGTDKTEGDGNFDIEQLAAFAAAVRVPIYNLLAPLKPEDVQR